MQGGGSGERTQETLGHEVAWRVTAGASGGRWEVSEGLLAGEGQKQMCLLARQPSGMQGQWFSQDSKEAAGTLRATESSLTLLFLSHPITQSIKKNDQFSLQKYIEKQITSIFTLTTLI